MALSTPLSVTGGIVQGTDHTYDIQPADDGATAGNTRGTASVDLQVSRALSTQVASGVSATISGGHKNIASSNYSTIGGGEGNTASATHGIVAGGEDNTASGNWAAVCGGDTNAATDVNAFVGGGINNTASGEYAMVGGGTGGTASGNYAAIAGGAGGDASGEHSFVGAGSANTASGANSAVCAGYGNSATGIASAIAGGVYAKADKYGQQAHSAGSFDSQGDAQTSQYVLRNSITHSDASWTELFLDEVDDQLIIATDTVWTFDALICGAQAGMLKTFSYRIVGAVKNASGTVTLKGTPSVTTIEEADDTDFLARVMADDATKALTIEVQDSTSSGDTIQWVCYLRTVEITFPAAP